MKQPYDVTFGSDSDEKKRVCPKGWKRVKAQSYAGLTIRAMGKDNYQYARPKSKKKSQPQPRA